MKTLPRVILFSILLLSLSGVYAFQVQMPIAQQGLVSPTPTYDPLAEPPLPPNPTELELGENLYWHWCMPCHGDKGQGLTDEFRGVWESDHQNCWARGCHTGRRDDMGFPIPTIVPSVVDENHLAQFPSLQEFSDYLQATHPPQSPGVLKSEEYHAIALFVFTMNGRPLVVITSTAAPTETMIPPQETADSLYVVPINIVIILSALVVVILVLLRRRRSQEKAGFD